MSDLATLRVEAREALETLIGDMAEKVDWASDRPLTDHIEKMQTLTVIIFQVIMEASGEGGPVKERIAFMLKLKRFLGGLVQ